MLNLCTQSRLESRAPDFVHKLSLSAADGRAATFRAPKVAAKRYFGL
jgi:hypothetical protein